MVPVTDSPVFDDRHVPLARLFALAFRTLMDALHERLRERGYGDVNRSFGFVLLAARQGPIAVRDVAELMGITKQAASKLVSQMEERRYVKRVAADEDARSRPFVLSVRGKRLLAEVERIYVELERRWAEELGEQGVESLRRSLTRVLRREHGGRLPAVRPG